MENSEFKKSIIHQLADAIDYVDECVVIKSIFKKETGTVTISSFDAGEARMVKSSPFSNFIQIIDGEAEVIIDDESTTIEMGQAIIIPAHVKNRIKANTRFKMLSTVIKSGYEDVSL